MKDEKREGSLIVYRKAVSPLISSVLLMAIVFSLAAIISPWIFNLTNDVTNETTTSVTNQITCRSAEYDFDTSFKNKGIDINVTTNEDKIDVKIVNTGTIDLHTFSLEVELDRNSSLSIWHFGINDSFQKIRSIPLKPGQSAILRGNVTEDLNGTITEVKVLNGVCPSNFVKQKV